MALTTSNQTPEHLRTKLYQKLKEFKGFQDFTPEDVQKVAAFIYKKEEMASDRFVSIFKKDKLSKYMETLRFLTNPLIHMQLRTYDERILYLIMSVDPELKMFREFLKRNITSIKDVNSITDAKEREKLNQQRNGEIMEFQTAVREQIGFYDSKLLMYEEVYFKRFWGPKELLTEIGQSHIQRLLSLTPFISSFDKVTDQRYEELQYTAAAWQKEVQKEKDALTAAYSATNQNRLLGLTTLSDQLIFFILASDPNLDALKIYEEESRIPEFERRMIEEFGYSSMDIIKLEQLYHDRFCPDKKISPWTITK